MSYFKPETGVSFQVTNLKFADLVPGKFGPQIRLKGDFNGEESVWYIGVPPFLAGPVLVEAGILEYDGDWPNKQNPIEENINMRVLLKSFEGTVRRPAGSKGDILVVDTGTSPQKAKRKAREVAQEVADAIEDEVEVEANGSKETVRPSKVSTFDDRLEEATEKYGAAMAAASDLLIRNGEALGIEIDARSVVAATATLFIAAH